MSAIKLLEKYYLPHTKAYKILRTHSEAVARKAVAISARLNNCLNHPHGVVDSEFVEQAALLHDIGIFATHAPSLGCYGCEPYLRHGIIGFQILQGEGMPRHAQVCQNHIGVGLTAREIVQQKLPLPPQDFLPQTLEEQIIAYADLFFSKNPQRLEQEKTAAQVRRTVVSFGADKGLIFDSWQAIFSPPDQ